MTIVLHGPADAPFWVTAIAPTATETQRLRDDLGYDADSLAHAFDRAERPRLRILSGERTFLVVRGPLAQTGDIPFSTTPISFLFEARRGLTVLLDDSPLAQRLAAIATAESLAGEPRRIVLESLEAIAEACLKALAELDRLVDATEDRLERSLGNREVAQLLRYQKSYVYFADVLEASSGVLERLVKVPAVHEDEALLEDALIEFRQARDTADIGRNVLSEMMDAFASIISNNLNVVMKALTAFTVILTIPMTIASLYGMNVELPFARSPHAFLVVSLVSASLGALVAVLFRRRRWL